MVSPDEQQLALAASIGGDPGSAHRVAKLEGAVDRLYRAASNLKTIIADIEWRGGAAEAAKSAFTALAGTLTEHAEALSAIAAADSATADPLAEAYAHYRQISSIDTTPGAPAVYGSGMVGNAGYRDLLATSCREQLDGAMRTAKAALTAATAADLNPPPPPPGPGGVDPIPPVTGTVPSGGDGGFDGTPGVTGTVPPGSTSPAGGEDGGFDGTSGVTGTVPPGSTSPAGGDGGGFDGTPGVTGTVPPGSTSVPSRNDGGFDGTGPVTGTVPPGATNGLTSGGMTPQQRAAHLAQRLG